MWVLLSLTRRATRVFVVATTSGFLVAGVVLGAHATIAATETIGCLVAYAQVVSSEASAARATFAAVTCLAARTVDHRSSPLNTLALSATCLLAASPLLVLDAGVSPDVRSHTGDFDRRTMPAAQRRVHDSALGAELALLPVAAHAFSWVSVAGLILNFVAIPLMTVAQVGGACLAVGVGLLHGGAVAAIRYVAHLAAAGIVESARLVDVLPVPPSVPLRQLRMAASQSRSAWRARQTGDTLRVGRGAPSCLAPATARLGAPSGADR